MEQTLKKDINFNFNKVPKFIYINEDGTGSGVLYIDGVKINCLNKMSIEANTNCEKVIPLKYEIKLANKENTEYKIIKETSNNGNL